jgi:hypothetical protein
VIASKRKNQERRHFGKVTSFPLADRRGCVVPFNRSIRADRRLNNLKVQEIPVDELARELE